MDLAGDIDFPGYLHGSIPNSLVALAKGWRRDWRDIE